jgi:hypothetical protein
MTTDSFIDQIEELQKQDRRLRVCGVCGIRFETGRKLRHHKVRDHAY